jgi:hypothetical protein
LEKGRQGECHALVVRMIRRKFGIRPELDDMLQQLQLFPVEKQEDLAEAILDWTDVSDLSEWLKQYK